MYLSDYDHSLIILIGLVVFALRWVTKRLKMVSWDLLRPRIGSSTLCRIYGDSYVDSAKLHC